MPNDLANEPIAIELHGHSLLGYAQPARDAAGANEAAAEGAFSAVDPATGQSLSPVFYDATPNEIDRAMDLADRAFDEFRHCRPEIIAGFLETIAEEIERLGDALIERARRETGLSAIRLTNERARTAGQARLFARMVREGSWVDARIDTALPDRQPLPRPDLRRLLVPIGPVVVFGAANFPLAISVAGCDTLAALAAGCPVVAKAHPSHPGTCEMVGQAILRAARRSALPDGVFSLLHGANHEVGLQLVCHPLAQAVAFTGSTRGGRALFDAAAARPRPIPFYGELGSTNPLFILPDALATRGKGIAEGFIQSVTLGVGQFCTRPGLVVTMQGTACDAFLSTVSERLAQVPAAPMLNDHICRSFNAGADAVMRTPSVSVAARGPEKLPATGSWAAGLVLRADARTFLATPMLAEEVFGPFALVVECDSLQAMEQVARAIGGHLAAAVHATKVDLAHARGLLNLLERLAGRIVFNAFPTGVEVCGSMHHGGPYPATTHSHFTSIGTTAVLRFLRPICYQDCPEDALPASLRDGNERRIWRWIDDRLSQGDVGQKSEK